MDLNRRSDPLLIGFIVLSLLLHLLALYLVPRRLMLPSPPPQKPMEVEMRPPAPRERELELPEKPDQQRTRPAKRLGPSDQQVARETAPKGRDYEDRTPSRPQPKPQPAPRPKPTPAARPAPAQKPAEHLPVKPQPAPAPATPKAPPATPPKQLPSLNQLLTLPQTTSDRIVSELRRKYRDQVAEGDAVWLDTERDLLTSFFRRFKDGIYRVWNYPERAAERGDEGVCLLKITIAHDGTVDDVKLVKTSGSPLLDNEALAAVRRGGPYGELPRSYTKKQLKIYAFFRYSLMRQHSSRFGDIF